MRIISGLTMMALSLSLSAEVITTYQDVESFDAATERLGRTPMVSELERYDMQVTLTVAALPSDPVDPVDPVEPVDYVVCASEHGICSIPTGKIATVRYGLNIFGYAENLSGDVLCNSSLFGDPDPGARKVCAYLVTGDIVPVEPEPEPEPVSGLFDRTSKAQMMGCLTRWDNQLNAAGFSTVLNSLSSMFDDKEVINNCIEDIREVVRVAQ